MYSVYQHWDPLKVCLVGKTYPPEFYSWISHTSTRQKFEKLAEETEEDYQQLISVLENKFGVKIYRPELPEDLNELWVGNKWVQPPTAPRDYFIMIHDRFWVPLIPNNSHAWSVFYRQNKLANWPNFVRPVDFFNTIDTQYHADITAKFLQFKNQDQQHLDIKLSFYKGVWQELVDQGNTIEYTELDFINGCFVSRLGQDLFFATQTYYDDKQTILDQVNQLFPNTSNRVVNSGGHGDAVYCPVHPGLIISLNDIPTYQDTFPNWEVVYLPPSRYEKTKKFESSMRLNKGRWFLPGFEHDQTLVNMMDHYFDEWVGQVSETVFDVNILVVDNKNIIVSSYCDAVEKACSRYGINVHVVPFRHRYFWDAGTHCITNDLHREGSCQKIRL